MSEKTSQKIPVIILSGFLGSGKTTILNHIVKQPSMEATAIIINEFGEIGIDHMLVETSEEQMIEINNGCICCTVRGDLADKLGSLAMWLDTGRLPDIERVIVETTGLADPAPIMHTMMTDQTLLNRFRLDHVITVVDSIAGKSSLDRYPEAVKQVAIADHLILSKSDLVDTHSDRAETAMLRKRLRDINPRADFHTSIKGQILVDLLAPKTQSEGEAALRDFSNWIAAAEDNHDHDHGACDHDHVHSHDEDAHHAGGDIKSFVIRFGEIADSAEFNDFLQDLMIEFGENLLRMKGILNVRERPDTPAVIHGVQHVLFPVTWLDSWPDECRESRLVFITEGLDKTPVMQRFELFTT